MREPERRLASPRIRRGRLIKKARYTIPAVVLGLIAMFASGSGAQAATTITVRTGDGAPGYSVNLFAPGAVYVQPGDTVKWTFPWQEPHSVTFGSPAGDPSVLVGGANPSFDGAGFISSGLIFGGAASTDTYSVTFPKKGTYAYFCILHPAMTGSVVVRTPDLGQPDNQASVTARGNAVIASAMAELRALAAATGAIQASVTPKPGGGRKFTLMISSLRDSAAGDVQQFFPANASISLNDTVEWVSNVHTPHTVSFGNPGDVAKLIPPGGAEAILGLPQSIPAGGRYDGVGVATSAVLGIGFPAGTKFELTFTKAGTFDYYCLLHADQQMVAKVTVAGAAPGAPNTGTSAAIAEEDSSGAWASLAAVLIIAASVSAAFVSKRR